MRILMIPLIILSLVGCSAESPQEEVLNEIETKIEGYGDEEYNKMQVGMTIEEVNEIIGFDGELWGSSTENGIFYETYHWQLNTDSSLSGDFENGILVFKGGYNPRDEWRQD